MVENKSVCVGIITYNSENTIVETLNSIVNQSYKNIKIIISDDNSHDNTVEVIHDWVKKTKSIDVTFNENKENLGVSGNLNKIISINNCEWIKFLAGDDLLTENCITELVRFSNLNDYKIISSRCITFGDYETVLPLESKKCFYEMTALEQFKYLGIGNFVMAPTLFYHAKTLKKLGGFSEKFKIIEDLPMLLTYTKNNIKIGFCDKILVKYRIHSSSTSLSRDKIYYFRGELNNIYLSFFKGNTLYFIDFEIKKFIHGVKNKRLKSMAKLLSPLGVKMKLKEAGLF